MECVEHMCQALGRAIRMPVRFSSLRLPSAVWG